MRRRLAALTLACAALLAAVAPATAAARKPFWLRGVTITEYYPAPEEWFVGRPVSAPGLSGLHRIDWLYSGSGIAMEGDGLGLDGKRYHLDSVGSGGWVNAAGRRTRPGRHGWSAGDPFWRAGGYWKNRKGAVTFPLSDGGWSHGKGRRYVTPPRGIAFGAGPSLQLRYWKSLATDPRVIPRGSRVFIPAYKKQTGGWFRAEDTGGAIIGKHVDVYRSPPLVGPEGAGFLTRQRVYVVPPK